MSKNTPATDRSANCSFKPDVNREPVVRDLPATGPDSKLAGFEIQRVMADVVRQVIIQRIQTLHLFVVHVELDEVLQVLRDSQTR